MSSFYQINGGVPLNGTIRVQGAKNSVLPILAASIVRPGVTYLHNCPDIRDVDAAIAILRHLGCTAAREDDQITVDSRGMTRWDIPEALMREMRSSVIFLGAIAVRTGLARMSYPGGCELGPRPIDLHLRSLRQLGMAIREENGVLDCRWEHPAGCHVTLPFPSVGATENTIIAALSCPGVTYIHNAAREPEILDLQRFLAGMGCRVSGAGGDTMEICGGIRGADATHTVIPDRIAAGTYLCCAAAAGGCLELTHTDPQMYRPLLSQLQQAGCRIDIGADRVLLQRYEPLAAAGPVCTMPYPGFPTDLQSPLMAVMCAAQGTTVFAENIFESRYRHVDELRRMGADILVNGRVAVVTGVERLCGTSVCAGDLRGGAALVAAALGAVGQSRVTQIAHLERGYEHLEQVLAAAGADIRKIPEQE